MGIEDNKKNYQNLPRTDWAERHVEDLLSLPLVKEFVFRSPMAIIGSTDKEVVDFYITDGDREIIISQKCQLDPNARDAKKEAIWAKKEAKKAAKQISGALRNGTKKPIWANHLRRDRVDFPLGFQNILHGIVLVEVKHPANLQIENDQLPFQYEGIPINYFSVNDFLNLAVSLRTIPELIEYLNARRSLPNSDLVQIGDERVIYEAYLLTNGTLEGVTSRQSAKQLVERSEKQLGQMIKELKGSAKYCALMEKVADELATRDENIPAAINSLYEPAKERKGYLKMQSLIASMRLGDRIAYGRFFYDLIKNIEEKQEGFTFAAARSDALPEQVIVFGASRKIARETIVQSLSGISLGALAYYKKRLALMVVDLDGKHFELSYVKLDRDPTAAEIHAGNQYFGNLKVTSSPISIIG